MDPLASLIRPASRTPWTGSPSALHLRSPPSPSLQSIKHGLRQPTTFSFTDLGPLLYSGTYQSLDSCIAKHLPPRTHPRRIPRPLGPRKPRTPIQLKSTSTMSPKPISVLTDATNTVRKGLRRMASGGLNGGGPESERPRARGKENYPPCPQLFSPTFAPTAPITPNGPPSAFMLPAVPSPAAMSAVERQRAETRRRVLEGHGIGTGGSEVGQVVMVDSEERYRNWAPVDGKIIIKVSVPCTDDIWRFKVPHDVSLRTFRRKVELKVGLSVSFLDPRVSPTDQDAGERGRGWEVGKKVSTEEGFRRWIDGREQDQVHPSGGPFSPNAALATPMLDGGLLSPTLYATPGMLNGRNTPYTPYTPMTPAMPMTPETPHRTDSWFSSFFTAVDLQPQPEAKYISAGLRASGAPASSSVRIVTILSPFPALVSCKVAVDCTKLNRLESATVKATIQTQATQYPARVQGDNTLAPSEGQRQLYVNVNAKNIPSDVQLRSYSQRGEFGVGHAVAGYSFGGRVACVPIVIDIGQVSPSEGV
ncbi:hypothetical protein BC629DRAFT_1439796 [Irpex lacteus]|nr:hypothetical protein BC629DRAFT_1439796 [Irpex lacteus]